MHEKALLKRSKKLSFKMLSVQIQYEGNGKGDVVFSLCRTKNYLLKCYQCKFSMREMEKEMWYSLYVELNIIFFKML